VRPCTSPRTGTAPPRPTRSAPSSPRPRAPDASRSRRANAQDRKCDDVFAILEINNDRNVVTLSIMELLSGRRGLPARIGACPAW
jgi:hypothetical protein